jgi:CDP-diglyceride synthetase
MKTKDIFQYALAALIVLVFFTIIYIVFMKELPTGNKDIGYMVIGALVVKFGDVVAYFFNSTKGSQEKTDIIARSPAVEPESKEVK